MHSLFSQRLPAGKTRWGFKEIRYGLNSGVPERMLTLFPQTKVIHAVRHPFSTISSTVRAWRPQVFNKNLSEVERRVVIIAQVRKEMARWKETTGYLADFCAAHPNKSMTVQIEEAKDKLDTIIEFLETPHEAHEVEVAREENPARDDEAVARIIRAAYLAELERDPSFAAVAARVNYKA
ncbi:hypothetical protein [Hyphomonas sp.]|uniref:hypothetical protein n=1 Tax=Hyphomonas sp. TaxID=87 RepID=UPI00391B1CC6